MNLIEVQQLESAGAKAAEAWDALLAAHKLYEAANGCGSREAWRVALRVSLGRSLAFSEALKAMLEAEGE